MDRIFASLMNLRSIVTFLVFFFPLTVSSFDLIPAVFTPFSEDEIGIGKLDTSKVIDYAKFLKQKQNISSVFVGGTNGESLSLTLEERKTLLEAWVEAAPSIGGMTIISHVGAESIVDAIALASHAKSLDGVASVAAMPPTFFRPSSVSELVAWFSPIAEAAYPLTIKYYHIPSMTNVAIDMDEFLVAASSAIPNFTGIKYTDTDLYTFTKCVSLGVGEMFYGKDETLTSGMLLGATSAVGSTYSFLAPTAWSAVHAWESGNVKSAQEYQGKITLLINTMLPYGGIPAQKAIVKMMGLDLGNVRLPLTALEEDQEANLKKDLNAIGFFDW
ncbi:hypothetical protein TrCOL_g6937 [Triparma columacea]|uniref:N-acetylneuraminate lyase n=1 Tax=Triparma columacea TaxID=722753 RepID=A0A9W7GE59_9STRA|nr:hypothetical protein TrCOL_g6937 [Triparma columacea]